VTTHLLPDDAFLPYSSLVFPLLLMTCKVFRVASCPLLHCPHFSTKLNPFLNRALADVRAHLCAVHHVLHPVHRRRGDDDEQRGAHRALHHAVHRDAPVTQWDLLEATEIKQMMSS
jgi:hypothetical protein